jgi:hypothetical protein
MTTRNAPPVLNEVFTREVREAAQLEADAHIANRMAEQREEILALVRQWSGWARNTALNVDAPGPGGEPSPAAAFFEALGRILRQKLAPLEKSVQILQVAVADLSGRVRAAEAGQVRNARPLRSLRITHADGSESTVEEVPADSA